MQDSTRKQDCQRWPFSKRQLWAILTFVCVTTGALFSYGYKDEIAQSYHFQSSVSISNVLSDWGVSPNLVIKKEYLQFWSPPVSKYMDLNLSSSFNQSRPNQLKEKIIVFFNPPKWLNQIENRLRFCSFSNCRVSFDKRQISRADVVVFHAVILRGKPPKRPYGQIWVLCGWESPVLTSQIIAEEDWKGVFNYTMTYRTDSDFFSPVGMFVKASKTPNLTELKEVTRRKRRTAAWIVSKCHVQSKRDKYVERMRKIIDVDIYGKCGNTTCGNNSQCLDMLSSKYKFYLSFENAFCKDYVTEKLFKTFNATCVAVVRGGADYASLVPSGTYINTRDFSSPESLAKHLKDMSENMTAYLKILTEKERFRTFGSYELKQMAFCKLCYFLNTPGNRPNTYNDVNSWYRKGICRAPSDV